MLCEMSQCVVVAQTRRRRMSVSIDRPATARYHLYYGDTTGIKRMPRDETQSFKSIPFES